MRFVVVHHVATPGTGTTAMYEMRSNRSVNKGTIGKDVKQHWRLERVCDLSTLVYQRRNLLALTQCNLLPCRQILDLMLPRPTSSTSKPNAAES